MNISILQENFKHGLFVVGHIAGKNTNLPILDNILIKTEEKNIKLVSTNLEIGVVNNVRGKITSDGAYTVNAKTISDYISLLPNEKINIEKKENKLIITTNNYKTSIKGISAEEYPLIPKIDKNTPYEISKNEFKKAISQTIFAVSNNETRIELSGVLFNIKNNSLIMAATDSYRLAEKKIKIKTNTPVEEKKVIIPAKTLQEIIRILGNSFIEKADQEDDTIFIYLSDNQILFTLENTELISRVIEGQYPDYQQIVPQNEKTKATINREELIRAVKASAIFSKSGINDISIDFPQGKNQTIISSASGQTGENITKLDSQVNGQDNGIILNYRYLLDGLNNIDTENIILEITDNNTPCLLKSEKDDSYLYIIMPIKQ